MVVREKGPCLVGPQSANEGSGVELLRSGEPFDNFPAERGK